ncbi:putative protein phosphatase 2C 26 [Citrus sinensis]|nr:putative protein phosphatase 2C 26 [Citrus sinensis]
MVVPVFRASVASFHPLFDSLCTRLSTNSSLPKNSRLLPFASSELNPVQSRLYANHVNGGSERVDILCNFLLLDRSYRFVLALTLFHTPTSFGFFEVERGGEDAFFVSCYNGGVIAVADGVSGWAEQNVDPSLFSRELMANASYFVEDVEVNYDPQILMRKAHAATSSVGSATVIVAMLERNGILKVASVGDCGLRIIRKGQITFSSSPQEHYFDCPYQLSSEAVGQTYLDAMVTTVELIEGDTIVMGSDGLFDNVFDHEIVSMTTRFIDVSEAGICSVFGSIYQKIIYSVAQWFTD